MFLAVSALEPALSKALTNFACSFLYSKVEAPKATKLAAAAPTATPTPFNAPVIPCPIDLKLSSTFLAKIHFKNLILLTLRAFAPRRYIPSQALGFFLAHS